MTSLNDVLDFWLRAVGPKGWFVVDPSVDAEIAARFGALTQAALDGRLQQPGGEDWSTTPQAALGLLILLDQFPRNLHRGTAAAFAGDARALVVANRAIDAGFDLLTPEPERMFFYMPFEHSERLSDQDRAVQLCAERLPSRPDAARHAELHRDLIVRFGRFPHRNAALGRLSTPAERAHFNTGGYAPGARPIRGAG